MRTQVRDWLQTQPLLDAGFRRHVWSRIHFPEAELRALNRLRAGSIDCAVDVGAALGGYAWVLSRKARRVLCYEPGQLHGDYLAGAVAHTNIDLVRAAVGREAGELEMFTPGDDTNARHMATLSRDNPVAQTAGTTVRRVPVVALDEDLPARLSGKRRIDVLKVDVEGFENAVFEGATATLARHRPLVIAEIESRHNPRFHEVFQLLEGLGYHSHFWRDGGYLPLQGHDIAPLQRPEDLEARLQPGHSPNHNRYINNFIFQHPDTRIKLA